MGVDTFSAATAAAVPAAQQLGAPQVMPTQTRYAFAAAGCELSVTFSTPALANDWNTWQRFPVTYLTFSVSETDGKSHNVSLYFEHTAELTVNDVKDAVNWSRNSPYTVPGVELLRVGSASQNVLGSKGDGMRISWGYQYLGIPSSSATGLAPGVAVQTTATSYRAASLAFVAGQRLPPIDPSIPRACDDDWVVVAAAWQLGIIGGDPVSVFAVSSLDQVQVMSYFGADLAPAWTLGGSRTMGNLMAEAVENYTSLIAACDAFDAREFAAYTAAAGGDERYAVLASLAYRQVTGATVAATPPLDGAPACAASYSPLLSDAWLFMEEMSSDGDVSTVDVLYPASPFLLYYAPMALWKCMIPIFDYANNCSGVPAWSYSKPFPPHDLGTWPIADRAGDNQEDMPLEEAGNMLLMAAAISNITGSTAHIQPYQWALLGQWASFINASLPCPPPQLATDDFAGPAPNNTNLVIKGVNGMAAWARLLDAVGRQPEAAAYRTWAANHAQFYLTQAVEGSAGSLHYRRQYPLAGSWSLKYNMLFHTLLDLRVFPESMMKAEFDYYMYHQAAAYGVPLDDRYSFALTEYMGAILGMSAMSVDTAAYTPLLLEQMYRFANDTLPRVPMTDWYNASTARVVGFQARATVGDIFALALLQRRRV